MFLSHQRVWSVFFCIRGGIGGVPLDSFSVRRGFGDLHLCMGLRLGPSAEGFVWPIPAFVAPLAGIFYPITTLPHWVQVIAKILPASYVFVVLGQLSPVAFCAGNPASLRGFGRIVCTSVLLGFRPSLSPRHANWHPARYNTESLSSSESRLTNTVDHHHREGTVLGKSWVGCKRILALNWCG